MDALCVVNQELQIPLEYMTAHSRPERVKCIVHISWLRSILSAGELSPFIEHDKLSPAEVRAWLKQGETFGPLWQKLLITVIDKPNKTVIPLPRPRSGAKPDVQLTFSQTCSYVAQTNYKNIWKEAYKKYSNSSLNGKIDDRQCKINLIDCGEALREVITRAYGCPIISLNRAVTPQQLEPSNRFEPHSNLMPALITLETDRNFLIIQEYEFEHSLLDCVRFSPAILSGGYTKPLFIIYQLLRLMRQLHDNGLVLGDITLSDILVSDNLWIQVLPRLEANIYNVPRVEVPVASKEQQLQPQQPTTPPEEEPCSVESQLDSQQESTLSHCTTGDVTQDRERERERELGRLCEAWVRGTLSNFDYLTALNKLAGRRYGDPRSHHVFPWVTDFSSRSGANWRDLTRSKFRLNKGDRQLDLTYDLPPGSGANQVPHHVSDVLSEITYYVYLCRVTERRVLQKWVRAQWVPAEYPSSIQRLQQWTPDECIPEFFTDPTVFKSIHPDLADLEVPSWAESAEDLVNEHRAILESTHVSDRLHHWIDLTFGYKLSGAAAVKSKNVCLQLVDGHTRLTNAGVVQLFTQPHPPHTSPSPYLSKTPPALSHTNAFREKKRGQGDEDDGGHSSGVEDEDVQISRSSPSGLSRILSRSRTSLQPAPGTTCGNTPLSPSSELQQTSSSPSSSSTAVAADKISGGNLVAATSGGGNSTTTIQLPRDYKPVAALVAVEALYGFLGRTCHSTPPQQYSCGDGRLEAPPSPADCQATYKQVVAARRVQEMVVLGCLIVELLVPSKLHVFGCAAGVRLQRRADICRSGLSPPAGAAVPRCMRQLVQLLLGGSGAAVTEHGTPPPSAHQLLQPSMSSHLLPFPDNYPQVYNMFRCLQEYNSALLDLQRVMIKDGLDGVNRTEGLNLLAEKINELKVKSLVEDIENLVERCSDSLVTTPAWIQLLLPHILPLLSANDTRVTASWYLFDPIARALGPVQSRHLLLEPMTKLYDRDAVTEAECHNANRLKKRIKIYHRSFLLRLIVRFGLGTFLEHFSRPLVEAVGGYHDFDSQTSSGAGISEAADATAVGNYGDVDDSVDDGLYPGNALSPLDEDSSIDSERNATETVTSRPDHEQSQEGARPETEVFVFEAEDSELEDTNTATSTTESKTLHNLLLIDQLSIDDQLTSADDLPLDNNNPRSPTIDIPPPPFLDGAEGGELQQHWRSRQRNDDSSSCGGGVAEKAALDYTKLYVREVSEVSAESVVWLAHRLGPVLTARYLSRDLLRMLALCYTGADNLAPSTHAPTPAPTVLPSSGAQGNCQQLVGDESAAKVLECLGLITALYGDQFVVLQFLPHIGDLISLCKRKLTLNLEGGLISCLVLFKHVLPFISDAVLAEILQDVILKTVVHPALRLVTSQRLVYPGGVEARGVVAVRLLECVYTLAVQLSIEQRLQLVHTMQRFFLAFSKPRAADTAATAAAAKNDEKDSATRVREYDSADSCSPPRVSSPSRESKASSSEDQRSKIVEEIKTVLGPSLAYLSFTSFANFFGDGFMEQTLKNYDLIQQLCRQYEQEQTSLGQPVPGPIDIPYIVESQTDAADEVGSFGTVIGNRIDLKEPIAKSSSPGIAGSVEDVGLIQKKMENSNRHLKGNWLAYWEHEIGRSGKDTRFNVKQIKLQSFGGHANSIRALHVLDNENSFFSASRDKTVKLWSLRSQGDGSWVTAPQWTYTGHRKCVVSLGFVGRVRLAVSSDSTVHLWDPFVGRLVAQVPQDSRLAPVNLLRPLPAPSAAVLAATMDATLKTLDARTATAVSEMKVSLNATGGVIRCMAMSMGRHWVALGQASGQLTILDLRTATVIASWRGHEGEVLQLAAVDDQTIVSSSLDQTVSVWNAADGKLICHMKGPTEPFHCLAVHGQELISATTANRIGVHSAFDASATFTSTRLTTDSLKGVLTVMQLLPLNRLILLGADTGQITLIC